jgi:[ribosomal protein S5]-alanine N-acetyltransferase
MMIQPKSFRTERLILRPTSAEDAPFLVSLFNSPKWIQNIGARNVHSAEEAAAYIEQKMLPQREKLGYSTFTIIRQEDQEKVGLCGLYDREGLEGIDLGFALLPEHEGKGYAFEAANELKRAGVEEFGISQIRAITTKDNLATLKLLEKLGLKFSGIVKLPNDEREFVLYEFTDSTP